MGACVSCNSAAMSPMMTAKVILPDGELREYSFPVRVADVLQKDSDWFICDADEMEFDGFVSSLGTLEELRPGQLYFVLPNSVLRQRLHAEDLASLAVKASEALKKAAPGGVRPGRRAVAPLVFPSETNPKKPALAGAGQKRGKSKAAGLGGKRKFTPELIAIPE